MVSVKLIFHFSGSFFRHDFAILAAQSHLCDSAFLLC